ncbi:MAG: 4'-phosphopantetheinyl transferase superfamily protein [Maribacter sp.]
MNRNTSLPRDISLRKGEVIIWQIDLNICENQVNDYLMILIEEEMLKANRFKFNRDKRNYIICRGVLRILIGHYLNMNPKDVQLKYNEFEKPYLEDVFNLHFNVSHSKDLAIIGFFMDKPIGVDIEYMKSDFDLLGIANSFFSKTEINVLKQIPEQEMNTSFYRCWTRKEAFIKAQGNGLSFPLDAFAVSLTSDNKATLLETKWDEAEKKRWDLHAFTPKEKYRAAFAIRGKVKSTLFKQWRHL